MQKKHFFFDVDNTLTRSRSPITSEMRARLNALAQQKDVVIISGQKAEDIMVQVGGVFPLYAMGQSGNRTLYASADGHVRELWEDVMNEQERVEIMAHIAGIVRPATLPAVPDPDDVVEDRGSQISYSLFGHHAPVEIKEKIDPQQEIRKAILAAHPLHSETVEVRIAGTTTLDYVKKGRNKGYNIERLLKETGWQKEDCVYFGDSLFPGGNDETVIGVIDTVAVENPEDTYRKLEEVV
jgi:phosphomannomutase